MLFLVRRQCRRCTGSELAILLVNHRPYNLHRLALRLHRHHVPRDVETNASRRPMAVESDLAIRETFGDITIGIMAVANVCAATKTRNVL